MEQKEIKRQVMHSIIMNYATIADKSYSISPYTYTLATGRLLAYIHTYNMMRGKNDVALNLEELPNQISFIETKLKEGKF